METLQPKLRFPEFKDNWKLKQLGDIGNFIGGGTPSTSNEDFWKGDIPWISSSDIFDNEIQDIRMSRFLTKDAIKESATKIIPKNSILLVSRVGVGKLAINKVEVCTSQDFTNIIVSDDNSYFIGYNLISRKNILLNFSQGTSIKGFTSADIKTLEINLPFVQEQTRIANFLSSVDEKLNLLKEKKALLEDYKKGIMQKIFNQEIRFKDENGNDFEEWEEKLFKEVFSFRSTNSFSRDKLNYFGGKVKNIHYGDIHTKFKTLFDIQNENVPFINSDLSIEKIPLDNYLKVGDLVIADASEDYDDIGKSIEIINLRNTKVLAGLHTFIARPFDNVLSIGFIGFLMKSDDIKLQIKVMAQGTKVLSLSATRFAEIKFSLPCLKEQTKIANFLSAIDEKIELISNQIQDTQEYKKGLLQQMFV
jgi:type I restriction enzyme S subunit